MEKRRLGKTEQWSSIVAFGGAALVQVSQGEADRVLELALENGVNHIDVAPSYGEAELRLAPFLKIYRSRFFLACKTARRSKDGVWDQLNRSLERLGVDRFDLYQLHGVSEMSELDRALGSNGAIEAILRARDEGLLRHIGITGHCPAVQVEALNRFPFETVMFPLNRVQAGQPTEYTSFEALLEMAKAKDVGVMAIKSVARRPWNSDTRPYSTWYEPFDEQEDIDTSLWFTLSHDVATCPMAGDINIVPKLLSAAARFKRLTQPDLERAKESGKVGSPVFPRD